MGIYDRDYMRRNDDDEPTETPREIARKGNVLAFSIVIGLLLVAGIILRIASDHQAEIGEKRIAGEQFQRIPEQSPVVVSEMPTKLRRLVDVNTATVDELQAVPYVGAALAAAIISHRPYDSLDELDKAPGIGKRKIEMLRPYLTVK